MYARALCHRQDPSTIFVIACLCAQRLASYCLQDVNGCLLPTHRQSLRKLSIVYPHLTIYTVILAMLPWTFRDKLPYCWRTEDLCWIYQWHAVVARSVTTSGHMVKRQVAIIFLASCTREVTSAKIDTKRGYGDGIKGGKQECSNHIQYAYTIATPYHTYNQSTTVSSPSILTLVILSSSTHFWFVFCPPLLLLCFSLFLYTFSTLVLFLIY